MADLNQNLTQHWGESEVVQSVAGPLHDQSVLGEAHEHVYESSVSIHGSKPVNIGLADCLHYIIRVTQVPAV